MEENESYYSEEECEEEGAMTAKSGDTLPVGSAIALEPWEFEQLVIDRLPESTDAGNRSAQALLQHFIAHLAHRLVQDADRRQHS